MATFKVGQRVKANATCAAEALIGLEGVIVAVGRKYPWIVSFPYSGRGLGSVPNGITGSPNHWGMHEYELSPLTDPGADAFLASLKKLGREPVIPLHTVPFGD